MAAVRDRLQPMAANCAMPARQSQPCLWGDIVKPTTLVEMRDPLRMFARVTGIACLYLCFVSAACLAASPACRSR
jgi:hypothetical protein